MTIAKLSQDNYNVLLITLIDHNNVKINDTSRKTFRDKTLQNSLGEKGAQKKMTDSHFRY